MKVTLRKEDEVSGWISKTTEYCLYVKVELADDEKLAIKKAGIDDLLLMPYSHNGLELNWKVKSVVYISDKGKEDKFVGRNAIERNEMEETIKEQLSALKSQITALMAGGTGTKTFEL